MVHLVLYPEPGSHGNQLLSTMKDVTASSTNPWNPTNSSQVSPYCVSVAWAKVITILYSHSTKYILCMTCVIRLSMFTLLWNTKIAQFQWASICQRLTAISVRHHVVHCTWHWADVARPWSGSTFSDIVQHHCALWVDRILNVHIT